MDLVDPLKQPQRFIQQADAMVRQSFLRPDGPDAFRAIEGQLDASFDNVLASYCAPPEAPAAAGATHQPAAHGVVGTHNAAAMPASAVSLSPNSALPGVSAPGGVAAKSAAPASVAAWDPAIQSLSSKYQVPDWLIRGVVAAESGGNPNAVSPVGAQGLMQLMPETARSLGVSDAFNPSQNLEGGVRYLRQLLDQFGGDFTKAVAAYNAGPATVQHYGGVPPIAETQSYVRKVLGTTAPYMLDTAGITSFMPQEP